MGKRGSKSKYVNRFNLNDKKMYLALSKNGVVTMEQLHKHCGVNDFRAHQHENSGLIRIQRLAVNGRMREILSLTKAGRDFCRREFGIQTFPLHNSVHVPHDIKQTELYFRFNEQSQKAWTPENSILAIHPEIQNKTCVDAYTYMRVDDLRTMNEDYIDLKFLVRESSLDDLSDDEMVLVGVESIGGKEYTESYIIEKESTARMLGCKAIMMK